ncbi:MAG: hypothetical protein KGI54_09555 [Pseudomonadota bacterium]|nr:hypothetical protein [Pseudomonadota bacterium]
MKERKLKPEMGRPRIFTQEEIEDMADELLEWMRAKPENVFFKYFCSSKNIKSRYLSEWEKQSDYFSEALSIAKEIQEEKLVTGSLFKKMDAGIATWMLCTNHTFTHPTKMAQASIVVMNEDEFVERVMNKKRGLDVKQDG